MSVLYGPRFAGTDGRLQAQSSGLSDAKLITVSVGSFILPVTRFRRKHL